jgi:hypothetical protein
VPRWGPTIVVTSEANDHRRGKRANTPIHKKIREIDQQQRAKPEERMVSE